MIDLSVGGTSWAGFTLSPWGRAKDCFIFTPDGQRYSAGDVLGIAESQADLCYLEARVRTLTAHADPRAIHFSKEDAALLKLAAELIEQALPRIPRSARRKLYERLQPQSAGAPALRIITATTAIAR